MNRMVIGHFLYTFGRGGMEHGVAKLINNSDPKTFRHVIISLTEDISLKERLQEPAVKVYALNKQMGLKEVIRQILKIVKEEKIDILHSRGWPTMLESVIIKILTSGLKIVYSFHGRFYEELKGVPIKRRIAQIILIRFFDDVVTLTSSMKKEIVGEFKIGEKAVTVIHNGVPIKNHNSFNNDQFRAEYHIPENEMVFGYVGRLDPVKGIETLIQAFDGFYSSKKKGYLFIVGEGILYESLKKKVSQFVSSPRIIFTGFRADSIEFMQLFDVYIQASLYEGLSNTILEAMGIGLPVICTNVGGNPDIVENGKNGYLIDVNGHEKLLSHMLSLSEKIEERKQMSHFNREKIKKEYCVKGMVARYESVYKKLFAPWGS